MLRIVVMLAVACAQVLAWQAPPAAQTRPAVSVGTAEVRGRVVIGAARTPVVGAAVKLASPSGLIMSAKTDADGRFLFTKVPAGQYTVSVSSNGLAVTAFGAGAARTAVIDVEDGARVDRGDLIMPSGVAISGVILDADGNPLKGANVSAWRVRYVVPGQRRLDFAGQAISDATGDYRIDGMKPGTYYVDAKVGESNAPTFFPATTDARMASAIRITADVGAAGISIRLLPSRLARVSGSISSAQGLPSSSFVAFLSPVRGDGAQVSVKNLMAEVGADGKFVIDKVPPGDYSVEVHGKSRLEKLASSGGIGDGIADNEYGSQTVLVDGRDVDDLRIHTALPSMIKGKFTLDGKPISANAAAKLQLRLSESSTSSGVGAVLTTSFASPQPDGAFSLPAFPGERLLRVDQLESGVTLRQITISGVDVTDDGFVVGESAMSDVLVALTSTPSRVAGRVSDSQGGLMPGAAVIVFSAEDRRWTLPQTRYVKTAKTDKNGDFTVSDLPAGIYYAAVVPTLVEGEWAEPSNLEQLRASATSFKLTEGEQKSLMLTVRR